MAQDFLQEIIAYKKSLLKDKKAFLEQLKINNDKTQLSRYGVFQKSISKPGKVNLIAEIKKASPSKGLIRQNFDAMLLAQTYIDHGADALSILTEDKFFLGKTIYLKRVSDNSPIPTLRKDFIIDAAQVHESYYLGASAILLIVAILEDDQLRNLMDEALKLDMDCLVEVHNEQELERALKVDAKIIGINNRDLHTFEVDVNVSEQLIPQIPKDRTIVAESGLKTHEEICQLKELGANAVLIGETFLREDDVGKKIDEIMQGVTK